MKESVALLKDSSAIGLCVSKFSSEKIYSTERGNIGITSHLQILQGHTAPHKKSGQKGSIARRFSKKCEPHERNRCGPRFSGMDTKTKPCTKNDAPAEQSGTLRKMSTGSNILIKLRFTIPLKPGQCRRPLQKKTPEERDFVVDSGASMHMLSKKRI